MNPATKDIAEASRETASIILAAGRGSRMKEFQENKTLLPLVPGETGRRSRPILLEILEHLPAGPKAVVVHYQKERVKAATKGLSLTYCEQPVLNGTGGGLLAARSFVEQQPCDRMIITMGDVPLVHRSTYQALIEALEGSSLVILGFRPASKRKYGVMEIQGGRVKRIVEWEYWNAFPEDKQRTYEICNSGIYSVLKKDLVRYLPLLASRPHRVLKSIHGRDVTVEEYFITDLVEYMSADGLSVGYVVAEDETEVMGVDDLSSLMRARELYQRR